MSDTSEPRSVAARRRVLLLLPMVAFLALGSLFYVRLGAGDASRIPSPLIGKPAPAFLLPTLEGSEQMSQRGLAQGGVTLVNFFASWCPPCQVEHPTLMHLAADAGLKAKGFRVVGIAYKDAPENTRRFLGAKGNPFTAVALDNSGRTAIDWGVYGVPESFLLRGDGTIAFKFIDAITPDVLERTIRPEIDKAMEAAQ